MEVNKIYCGDCLQLMSDIHDNSVDLVLTDPPFGTTNCKWDTTIPFGPMWMQLNRITKQKGIIVLFGSEPFSSFLRISNIQNYKYDLIWEKSQSVGFLNAWKMPLRETENISVFYTNTPTYNPRLKDKLKKDIRPQTQRTKLSECYGGMDLNIHKCPPGKSMPKTIIKFNNEQNNEHPTQKPIPLMEYLVETYSNKGDLVLDFTCGSGTTAVACKNTHRNFIAIEKEPKYVEIAKRRVANAQPQLF